jgi:hypothetical protein
VSGRLPEDCFLRAGWLRGGIESREGGVFR